MSEIPGPRNDTADEAGAVRLEAVGLLAAGLAHDLNTLLGGIMSTAELMAARLPTGSDLAADLDLIVDQTERAGGIIRQLLAFSRQERLAPVRLQPAELIGRMAPILRALVGKQIGLSLPSRRCGLVRVDPQALERAIMNLVTNARDAIGGRPGHIAISCAVCEAGAIPEHARGFMPPVAYSTLSVADDGPGVPATIAHRIFDPFFTTKPPGEGTGLGLSTAYGLIKQSGGFLLLEPSDRRGARFTIYLPLAEELSAAAPGSGKEGPLILLAEDETLLRVSTRRGLEGAGFRVLATADAESARTAFRLNPDVAALVSDLRMPGDDGIALARTLRQSRPNLPVLFVSGYADMAERDALQGLDAGFLPKPFRLSDLRRAVEAMV
jgi:two-component system cell cycle sensor histidine kinase/response regulator CckA